MTPRAHVAICPEHVGRRVTLRYTLAGEDTPGSSEAVGVLLAWPDDPAGEILLENRRGERLRIPLPAIVVARVVG